MRIRSLLLAIAAVPGLAVSVQAEAPLPGLYFSHADWELACDNSGTCRAAGYHAGQGAPAVSVLLTRKAGPGQPVSGQLLVGQNPALAPGAKLPSVLKLTLRIDGKNAGTVSAGRKSVHLPPGAVAAMLAALPGTANIAWRSGPHNWPLSSQGAAAVLLKMDEFQGRIGTRGALIKPGARSEAGVPKAAAVPVVQAARWAPPLPDDQRLAGEQAAPLLLALRATLGEQDYCPDLDAGEALALRRLDAQRLLASTRCWAGPYNVGHGYWVISAAPPFKAELVTTSGTDAEEPFITASHKGRGLGDCRASDAWTWNGAAFIHTSSATTGMCRMAAAGGAWELPRIVSDVRPPPSH